MKLAAIEHKILMNIQLEVGFTWIWLVFADVVTSLLSLSTKNSAIDAAIILPHPSIAF